MTAERSTRWARGAFRFWLVLSLIWLALVLTLSKPWSSVSEFLSAKETASNAQEIVANIDKGIAAGMLELKDGTIRTLAELQNDRPRIVAIERASSELVKRRHDELLHAGLLAFVPPLIILVVGFMFGWAVKGFNE